MKKSVAAAIGIAIVAGVWLGGVWYTGKKLETEMPAQIALANQRLAEINPSADIILRQVSFERGFFGSNARYALSIGEKGADPQIHLELDSHYQHGPFPLEALSRGRLMPTLAYVHSELVRTDDSAPWFKLAGNQAPLSSNVLMSYNGDAQFDIHLSPLSLDEDGDMFSFSGADLEGRFHAENMRSVGTFRSAQMSMDVDTEYDGRVTMSVADSEMDFDTYQNRFGMHSGQVELRAGRMALRLDEEGDELVIEQIAYGGSSSEDETFVQGEVYLNTGSVAVNGLPFGSQSLTIKVDRLDGLALKLVADAYNQMVAHINTNDGAFGDMDSLMQAGQALLEANPTLSVDNFSWTTDKGSSTVFMHSEWQPPADINVPDAMLLAELIKAMRVDLSLNKPMVVDLTAKILQLSQDMDAKDAATLAALQLEEILGMVEMLGLSEEDGDTLKSRIEFDGQQGITVNGEELPPEILLGLLLAM